MDRFTLEDHISKLNNIQDDLDAVIYRYADAKQSCTEDHMLNMLIGVKELHQARWQQAWDTFEHLVTHKKFNENNN